MISTIASAATIIPYILVDRPLCDNGTHGCESGFRFDS